MKKIRIFGWFFVCSGKRSEGPWAPLGHLWCWVSNVRILLRVPFLFAVGPFQLDPKPLGATARRFSIWKLSI